MKNVLKLSTELYLAQPNSFNPQTSMKTLKQTLRAAVIFAALVAMHQAAFAAKTWSFLGASPATTNVTAGVATNVSTIISAANGTGASARYQGVGTFSLTLSPDEPTISVSIDP